jgi:hypothetical protein
VLLHGSSSFQLPQRLPRKIRIARQPQSQMPAGCGPGNPIRHPQHVRAVGPGGLPEHPAIVAPPFLLPAQLPTPCDARRTCPAGGDRTAAGSPVASKNSRQRLAETFWGDSDHRGYTNRSGSDCRDDARRNHRSAPGGGRVPSGAVDCEVLAIDQERGRSVKGVVFSCDGSHGIRSFRREDLPCHERRSFLRF